MTKPKANAGRECFGIVASRIPSSALKAWNGLFLEEGRDAVMSAYPTEVKLLPERLSEMFHFDRRGYVVEGVPLQRAVIPLLDELDRTVSSRVDTILNRSGLLVGYFFAGEDAKRRRLWLSNMAKSS